MERLKLEAEEELQAEKSRLRREAEEKVKALQQEVKEWDAASLILFFLAEN